MENAALCVLKPHIFLHLMCLINLYLGCLSPWQRFELAENKKINKLVD